MRKDFGPQTWLYPMPVLIIGTYGPDGVPDAMNAAWGGIHDTDKIGVCIAPSHRTAENLLRKRAFTVSVGTAEQLAACDYVGLVSGKNEPRKLDKAGWHTRRAAKVDAPLIDELPFTLECELESYDQTTGCAVGVIVNVSIDERILDGEDKVDPAKLKALTFDPVRHLYLALGPAAGCAFKDGLDLPQKRGAAGV